MSDNCCQFCVPPKRYPGCHDHCQERAEWKRTRDQQKAEYAKKHEIDGYFCLERGKKVEKARKAKARLK